LEKVDGSPDRIVDPKPDEPPEQEIMIQSHHELALGSNGIQRLQEHGPQETLWRDRGPLERGILVTEGVIHRDQGVVDEPADRSQGMILPDAFLQVDV